MMACTRPVEAQEEKNPSMEMESLQIPTTAVEMLAIVRFWDIMGGFSLRM